MPQRQRQIQRIAVAVAICGKLRRTAVQCQLCQLPIKAGRQRVDRPPLPVALPCQQHTMIGVNDYGNLQPRLAGAQAEVALDFRSVAGAGFFQPGRQLLRLVQQQ